MSLLHRRMMMESNMGNYVRYEELKPLLIDGEYVSHVDGADNKWDGYRRTDFIPISVEDNLLITIVKGASTYNAFYDADKKFIKNYNNNEANACRAKIPIIPPNAKFMKLSYQVPIDNVRIFKLFP